MTTAVIHLRDIEQYATAIAQILRPRRIVLFGSHAYGKPTRESDVDLLVEMDEVADPVTAALRVRRAVAAPFPVDLLVRSSQDIQRRIELGDYFVQDIVARGKELYASAD